MKIGLSLFVYMYSAIQTCKYMYLLYNQFKQINHVQGAYALWISNIVAYGNFNFVADLGLPPGWVAIVNQLSKLVSCLTLQIQLWSISYVYSYGACHWAMQTAMVYERVYDWNQLWGAHVT